MGRPFKCACGSTETVSKGVRRTKSMGNRRIRLCKACGRKFTPKNQKATDAEMSADTTPPSTAIAENSATVAETVPPADITVATQPGPEAMDHPRF
jgi:hypothetical protein